MADAPEQIGRYQILRLLGRGRLGDLYLAMDPVLEREVALRVAPPLSPEQRELWTNTLESSAGLQHHALATIYDLGDHEGGLYAREYVPGQALRFTTAKTRVPLRRQSNGWWPSAKQSLRLTSGDCSDWCPSRPTSLISKAGEARIVTPVSPSSLKNAGWERRPACLAPRRSPGGLRIGAAISSLRRAALRADHWRKAVRPGAACRDQKKDRRRRAMESSRRA